MSVPERVRNHWWWRPGWRAGRPIYSWHFILPSDETIRAHAAAYQEVLSAYDVLDIVPLEWLHMTTQDVCFADEISDADRDAMVEDVRGRLRSHEPFTVTFGAPTVWTEGVVLLPEPNAPFAAVREELRAGVARARGADRVPGGSSFRAHMSLAYANGDGPTAPIAENLTSVRRQESRVRIDRVSLLHQERVGHLYRWSVVAEVPLGI